MFKKWFNTYIKANNIFIAQWPIILICRSLGLISFKLVLPHAPAPPNFQITVLGLIMPFVFTVVYLTSFCLTMTNRTGSFFMYFVPNGISNAVSYAQLVAFLVGVVIVYGSVVFKCMRLIELFNLLSQIDEKFQTGVNVMLDYSQTVKCMLKCIAWHWLTYGTYITMNLCLHIFQGRTITIYNWISYFTFNLAASILILKFIWVLSQLKYRFSLLKQVSEIVFCTFIYG